MKPNRKLPTLQPAPTRSAGPRWPKRLAFALLVYAVFGFLILPAILKWQLRKQLPGLTQRQVAVKQVRMNPFALSLTVRGLALTETNGAAFAAFDELYVNFQLSSLFRRAWTFGEIHLTHPTANLLRLADGSFNFSNLISTNSAPPTNAPSAPPAILVQSFLITNAVVSFADQATPRHFQATYGPIHMAITDFTTRRAKDGPYTFEATTSDGEKFTWSGRITAHPPQSSGQFQLTGISPAKYGPYLAQFTTVQVQRGKLDIGASYRVNAASVPLELELTNATVRLHDLLVQPPESDATLLALDQLVITNTFASLTGRVARVGLVSLNGGSVFIGRETNGQPTLLNYLVAPPAALAEVSTSEPGALTTAPPLWRIDLDELDIARFKVALEDHSPPTVAELGLEDLALNVKGLSTQTNTPVATQLAFHWRGGGAVQLTTRGTLLPPAVQATIAITNLALAPLQPYVGQYLNLVVHSGSLNVNAAAQFDPIATPLMHFTGEVGVTNFASSDTVAYHELAAWENLAVRGIDFSLATNHLAIAEIKLTGARNNLVVSSNGQVNLSALIKLPPTNRPPEATVAVVTNAPRPEPFPISVGALTFERTAIRAADDSLLRRFETSVEEFNGSIRNIVLPGAHKASVDIRGRVSAQAPFEIAGEVTPDPANLYVDLKITFTNTDLTSLSPYTEKYVGRPLSIGKLTTELTYHIENRALTANNIVALNQLTLGGRVESPDATKLPVKLAIGLLKDMNGRIDLDLPLSGSLDDPSFSIWGLVGQTFQNLILKVATSPFSLLGALVGGGDDMQFVAFAPGSFALAASETNKLMKLTKALEQRPALSLELSAAFDPITDIAALRQQKLLENMKLLRISEIVARGKPAPALATLQLEDDDYDRLLRKAYRTAFNTTPESALRQALEAASSTNAPGEIVRAAPAPSAALKGATALRQRTKSLSELAVAAPKTKTSAAGADSAKPKTERELIRGELEQRLAAMLPVTNDDLRVLLQQRMDVVQQFLVGTGNVLSERILPTAPKPEDPIRNTAARVVFALE